MFFTAEIAEEIRAEKNERGANEEYLLCALRERLCALCGLIFTAEVAEEIHAEKKEGRANEEYLLAPFAKDFALFAVKFFYRRARRGNTRREEREKGK